MTLPNDLRTKDKRRRKFGMTCLIATGVTWLILTSVIWWRMNGKYLVSLQISHKDQSGLDVKEPLVVGNCLFSSEPMNVWDYMVTDKPAPELSNSILYLQNQYEIERDCEHACRHLIRFWPNELGTEQIYKIRPPFTFADVLVELGQTYTEPPTKSADLLIITQENNPEFHVLLQQIVQRILAIQPDFKISLCGSQLMNTHPSCPGTHKFSNSVKQKFSWMARHRYYLVLDPQVCPPALPDWFFYALLAKTTVIFPQKTNLPGLISDFRAKFLGMDEFLNFLKKQTLHTQSTHFQEQAVPELLIPEIAQMMPASNEVYEELCRWINACERDHAACGQTVNRHKLRNCLDECASRKMCYSPHAFNVFFNATVPESR